MASTAVPVGVPVPPPARRAARAADVAADPHGSSGGAVLVGAAVLAGGAAFLMMRKGTAAPVVPGPGGTTTGACPAAQGQLVMGQPSGRIYVMVAGGAKSWIADYPTFQSCRYDMSKVIQSTDAALASCPDGPPITGPSNCAPGPVAPLPPVASACPASGTLVRGNPSGRIYVMVGGTKSWVTDYPTFQSCRYDLSKVVDASDTALAGCPDGAPITSAANCAPGPLAPLPPAGGCAVPAETLVQGTPSGRIYAIEGGAKRWITDYANFQACHYSMAGVVQLSDAELAGCPDGAPITGPPTCATVAQPGPGTPNPNPGPGQGPGACTADLLTQGRLLQGVPSGNVYVADNGGLSPVLGIEFGLCGYNKAAVVRVDDALIAKCHRNLPVIPPLCPRPGGGDPPLPPQPPSSSVNCWPWGTKVRDSAGQLWVVDDGNLLTKIDDVARMTCPYDANLAHPIPSDWAWPYGCSVRDPNPLGGQAFAIWPFNCPYHDG